MGRIHQLDTQTANLIAAGEVVERPMGVVKELVENAIDAGSTQITISIEEGGISKITISDNGCGMSSEDAEMAFKRHATSKIQGENDLFSIHTLGFRGEALPSIASVSQVTLVTSDGKDNTRVVIAYGEKKSASPYPCNQGTEITVEGLFYHTPARLKHMRSASYESSLIQDVINRFALSHPEIAFHFINDGRDVFRTSGQGNLLEVVFNVYGRSASENAIEVDFEDFDYHVTGYLIKPEITRASNKMMHVFLNGRMVRTYRIYKAIQDGYEGLIPSGRYPLCVLSIEMDPHLLDVNVHPSKWEVRISKEIQLETLIKDQVHQALNVEDIIPVREVKEAKIEYYQPLSFDEEEMRPEIELPKKETVEEVHEDVSVEQSIQQEKEEDEALLRSLMAKVEPAEEKVEESVPLPELRVIGQLHRAYILCETDHALAVVDQTRAYRKVLFEEILNQMDQEALMQDLLVPLTVHTSDDIVQRCDEINEVCKEYHLVFEPFGNDTLIVRSLPVWMKDIDEQFLVDLIDAFKSDDSLHFAKMKKQKIAKIACSHIKKKSNLSIDEMKELIQKLSQCKEPMMSVDHKPVLFFMDVNDLIKEFR